MSDSEQITKITQELLALGTKRRYRDDRYWEAIIALCVVSLSVYKKELERG